ncbi:MAG TPA: hypothetical protein VE621_13055, partial [Bryobacteraceae bacterium]|nr:hypothetical protein [Bryobacteraceae bacterium]
YEKTMRLMPGKPVLLIEHKLRNTGSKPIQTTQYNHNFFVIDGKATGPASSVKFPFNLQAERGFQGDAASVKGGQIVYNRELEKGQSVYGEFKGFGSTASDYNVTLENREAGAGVRITGDKPLSKVVYWSIRTTFCPEPYVDIAVEPGKEQRWTYRYEFYNVKAN